MKFFAITGLINAIAAISMGLLIIIKNYHTKLNKIFLLLMLSVTIWGFGYYQWLSSVDYSKALFWIRILSTGSIFIPTLSLHWVVMLLNKEKENYYFLWFEYVLCFTVLVFSFSPSFIPGLEQKLFFRYWPIPGILYHIHLVFLYIIPAIYGLYILVRGYKNAAINGKDRGQIICVLLAIVFGLGGGFWNYFLWYDVYIPPYGNVLVAAFVFVLGYSIIKHELFNVRIIVAETLVFILWFGLLFRVILSENSFEATLNICAFSLAIIIGIFLIRGVKRELNLIKNLQERDELKSRFTSLATHHISSPLTAIKGYVSMLEEGEFDNKSQEGKKALGTVHRLVNNLVIIIRDFLDISRLEKNDVDYVYSELDVGELVDDILHDYRNSIEAKDIKLIYENEDAEKSHNSGNLTVRADGQKLSQAISNILDNSLKYTNNGFIAVNISCNKNLVQITISDSGTRIMPTISSKLTKMFTNNSNENEAAVIGNGLGLYAAKQFIEAQGGTLHVESENGESGWKFILQIPRI